MVRTGELLLLATPGQASGSVLNRMPNSPRPGERWTAIVPVRSLTEGKSRLLTGSSPAPGLIEAFARDVLRACGESANIGRTIVVSPDASIEALAREANSEFVPEPSASGINEAIASVRAICAPNQPVIGILADTPCLTGATLDAVLTHARDYDVSFVADAAGTGSTMWCAQVPGARSFFVHLRAHHRASGAVEWV